VAVAAGHQEVAEVAQEADALVAEVECVVVHIELEQVVAQVVVVQVVAHQVVVHLVAVVVE